MADRGGAHGWDRPSGDRRIGELLTTAGDVLGPRRAVPVTQLVPIRRVGEPARLARQESEPWRRQPPSGGLLAAARRWCSSPRRWRCCSKLDSAAGSRAGAPVVDAGSGRRAAPPPAGGAGVPARVDSWPGVRLAAPHPAGSAAPSPRLQSSRSPASSPSARPVQRSARLVTVAVDGVSRGRRAVAQEGDDVATGGHDA